MSYIVVLAFWLNTNLSAQVKEVNTLGKIWYVHGVDFRVKAQSLGNDNYYFDMVQNTDFNNDAYQEYYTNIFNENYDFSRSTLSPLTEISVGAVFRPLHRIKFAYFRGTEFSHNFIFQRLSNRYLTNNGELDFAIRTNHMGYNPRLMLNSRRFLEYLKLYASADAYVYLPLSGFIYTRPDEKFLPNGGGSYSTSNLDQWTDRIPSSFLKYGSGFTIGLKMYVSCKWNFHIEGSTSNIHTYFGKNISSNKSEFSGVQVGLRCKFGKSEEEEEDVEDEGSSVFW